MKQTPTVSVIVPAYNSATTIVRALDTVFAQTWPDFEVIVIDDGSDDDLEKVLLPYDGSVTLIRQQNHGAAAARNTGARAARGQYLAFLDADDFWHERKLELQLRAFEQRPDTVLCWTHHQYCAPGPTPLATPIPEAYVPEPQFGARLADIFLWPYLGTPGVMMPRDVFTGLGGFREDLKCAEDVDLWLRAAHFGPTALIPWPLFYVVRSPSSLTSSNVDAAFGDNLRVIKDFCSAHPEFAKSHRILVRRARSRVYEDWGSSMLAAGAPAIAARLLGESLMQWPRPRAALLLAKTAVMHLCDRVTT
jgi:glycosyltransferase involved in cell wall biosynthesis